MASPPAVDGYALFAGDGVPLGVAVHQLEPLLEQIKEYDKEIERLFKLHSDSMLFASLPGAGMRLAPRLLAEWGDDRERFLNASVVQALAGTSPVLYQSGKYRLREGEDLV